MVIQKKSYYCYFYAYKFIISYHDYDSVINKKQHYICDKVFLSTVLRINKYNMIGQRRWDIYYNAKCTSYDKIHSRIPGVHTW